MKILRFLIKFVKKFKIKSKTKKKENPQKQKCFSCKKKTNEGEIRRSGKFLCINCIIYLHGGIPKYADIKKKLKKIT